MTQIPRLPHLSARLQRHNAKTAYVAHTAQVLYHCTPSSSIISALLPTVLVVIFIAQSPVNKMSAASSHLSKPPKISQEAFEVSLRPQYTRHPSNAHTAIGHHWSSLGHSNNGSGRPCIHHLLPSSPFRGRRRLLFLCGYHIDIWDYCVISGRTLHLFARKRRSWPARSPCRHCSPAPS